MNDLKPKVVECPKCESENTLNLGEGEILLNALIFIAGLVLCYFSYIFLIVALLWILLNRFTFTNKGTYLCRNCKNKWQPLIVEEHDAPVILKAIPKIEMLSLSYNDEAVFIGEKIDPLFIQVAYLIVENKECSYGFLYKMLGLYHDRVNEIAAQLIKYGIIARKRKKENSWKVLIHNEIQLEELLDHYKKIHY